MNHIAAHSVGSDAPLLRGGEKSKSIARKGLLRTAPGDIQEVRRYAREVRQAIDTLEFPDVEAITRKKGAVLRAAEELIRAADQPVRIGVVGEFGAGKSLLLGALVGRADLLPVSEIPTTGNVTALKLKQSESVSSATEIGAVCLEYLDRQGVMECFEHFLETGVAKLRAAGLSNEAIQRFSNLDATAVDFHDQMIECCRMCWNETQDPALRYFLKELVDFSRTDRSFGSALYGQRVEVPHAMAHSGLQLPRLSQDIASMRFVDLTTSISHEFSASPSVDQLRESFLLIRRCEIEVTVSRHAWEMESDFVLLDFPGLGAGTSGVRDRYLCQRELHDVQTILVLLNAQRPGAGGVNEFYQMMEQEGGTEDSFLTAISRFDQLPMDEQAAAFLDGHAQPAANIADEEVLSRVPALDTLVKSACAFTKRADRIFLLSPLRSLQTVEGRADSTGSSADERWEAGQFPMEASATRWNRVSKLLGDTSILRRWLADFAHDGSLGSIRRVIESHAAEHGIRQLSRHVAELGSGLSREVENLCLLLERTQHRAAADSPREVIVQALNRLVGVFASLSHLLREEARELKVDDVCLHKLIHDRSVIEVGKWKEWTLLLNSSEEGFIAPPRSQNRSLLTGRRRDHSNMPTSSSDFESSYLASCARLGDYTIARAREALQQWMAEFAAIIEESELTRELGRSLTLAREEPSDEFAEAMEILEVALNLRNQDLTDRLLVECRESASIGEADDQEKKWRSQFPMSLGKEFAWSPELASKTQNQARHQVHLRQFNQQFVESLSRQFSEVSGRMNESAIDALIDTFLELSIEIRSLAEDRVFLSFLSGEPLESEGSADSSTASGLAHELRQIRAFDR